MLLGRPFGITIYIFHNSLKLHGFYFICRSFVRLLWVSPPSVIATHYDIKRKWFWGCENYSDIQQTSHVAMASDVFHTLWWKIKRWVSHNMVQDFVIHMNPPELPLQSYNIARGRRCGDECRVFSCHDDPRALRWPDPASAVFSARVKWQAWLDGPWPSQWRHEDRAQECSQSETRTGGGQPITGQLCDITEWRQDTGPQSLTINRYLDPELTAERST